MSVNGYFRFHSLSQASGDDDDGSQLRQKLGGEGCHSRAPPLSYCACAPTTSPCLFAKVCILLLTRVYLSEFAIILGKFKNVVFALPVLTYAHWSGDPRTGLISATTVAAFNSPKGDTCL